MPTISSWAAGQGGSSHGDGKSALLYPTSAANTSVELMETRAPVLVLEKSFVTDSAGPGRHRGGCGVRTRLRKLYDDGLPTLASVYPEGVGVTVEGLHGGQHGGGVRGVVLDPAGNVLRDCGTGELVTLTRDRPDRRNPARRWCGLWRSARAAGDAGGAGRRGGHRFAGSGAT